MQPDSQTQNTYRAIGIGRACLAKHRIAVLREEVGDTGHSGWQIDRNVLICSGSCFMGTDRPRTISDSMEGVKRERGDSRCIEILNRAF